MFKFRQQLNKTVYTFIHPGSLTFIIIDNHREEIVPDFMYNYTDHFLFGACRVATVFIRSSEVEAYHGVFHSNTCRMYRYGYRVWVVNGVFRVYFECMLHGLRRFLLP